MTGGLNLTPDRYYFVAPFTPDGERVAVAARSLSTLSPRWLGFCQQLLSSHGTTFRCAVPLPGLDHITLTVTSSDGVALVSFSVHGEPASSAIALSGAESNAESEALRLFVDSMRRVPFVQEAAGTATPFQAMFGLAERPLYMVIPWANPRICDADQELVQQLENHLAAALLTHGHLRST